MNEYAWHASANEDRIFKGIRWVLRIVTVIAGICVAFLLMGEFRLVHP